MKVFIENEIVVEDCPPHIVDWAIHRLTMDNPAFMEAKAFGRRTYGIPRKLTNFVWAPESTTLRLPRGILPEFIKLVQPEECSLVDNTVHISDNTVSFVGELRPYQRFLVDRMLDGVCGIGVAPPGSGKTTTAIGLICESKCRTLWITHTSDLANQSTARIKHFTNVDKVGYIGSGKWVIEPITVALVQTLARRDLSDIVKAYDLIIIDEAQHIPALLFNQVVKKFWARRLIGLSATPYRKDGLEPILFDTVGPVLAIIEKETLIKEGRVCPATIVQKELPLGNISLHGDDFVRLSKQLAKDPVRNRDIIGDVAFEFSLEHRCIVLVSKIEHGRLIEEMLNRVGVPARLVFSTRGAYKRGKRVGTIESMSKKEREGIVEGFVGDPGNNSVLIATFKLLAEGFDYDKLDRLFLAAPISPRNQTLLEQTCGRVERMAPGKVDAVVYDYIDKNRLLQRLALKRRAVYEELRMPIRGRSTSL